MWFLLGFFLRHGDGDGGARVPKRTTQFPHFFLNSEEAWQGSRSDIAGAIAQYGAVVISTDEPFRGQWGSTALAVNAYQTWIRDTFIRSQEQLDVGTREFNIEIRRKMWTRTMLEQCEDDADLYRPRNKLLEYHDRMGEIGRRVMEALDIPYDQNLFVLRGFEVFNTSRRIRTTVREEAYEKGYCVLYDHLSVDGLQIGDHQVRVLLPGDVLVQIGTRVQQINKNLRAQPSVREVYKTRSRMRDHIPESASVPQVHFYGQGVYGLPGGV